MVDTIQVYRVQNKLASDTIQLLGWCLSPAYTYIQELIVCHMFPNSKAYKFSIYT